jgi:hypothetical protein
MQDPQSLSADVIGAHLAIDESRRRARLWKIANGQWHWKQSLGVVALGLVATVWLLGGRARDDVALFVVMLALGALYVAALERKLSAMRQLLRDLEDRAGALPNNSYIDSSRK